MARHGQNGLVYGTRGDKKVYNISEELSNIDGINGLNGGVSVGWLMKAFRMGRQGIESKMLGCPSIGRGKHGVLLYDIPTAASFLVTPRKDLSRYLEKADVSDLPEKLREPYWNAKLKEQRYLEKAGELWSTDLVVEKISTILADMRAMLILIPDDLEREAALSPDQRRKTKARIDVLQNAMYQHIMGLRSNTLSQRGQFLEEIESTAVEEDEPEDDDEDLIGAEVATSKYEFI